MGVLRAAKHESSNNERDSTLLEALSTIALMGIVVAIASSTWLGTKIAAVTTKTYKLHREASVTSGDGSPTVVRFLTNASDDHTVELNAATSRIRAVG